jgi:hypothetical protein
VLTKNFHHGRLILDFSRFSLVFGRLLCPKVATSTKSLTLAGKGRLLRSGTLPVGMSALAHACVVASEVMGELDGEFEEDTKGAVDGTGGE